MPNTAMNFYNPGHLTSHNQKVAAFEIMWVIPVCLLDILKNRFPCALWLQQLVVREKAVAFLSSNYARPVTMPNCQTTTDQPLLLVKDKQSSWAEKTTVSVRVDVGLPMTLHDESSAWIHTNGGCGQRYSREHLLESFKAFGNVLG